MVPKAVITFSVFLFCTTSFSAELPLPPLPSLPEEESSDAQLNEAVRELEELRAVEEAAVEKGMIRAEEVFQAMRRAGPYSPLHQRWSDALGGSWPIPMFFDENELEASALAEIGSFDIDKARNLYDIPVEMNSYVADYIRFFQTTGRKHFVKWLNRSSRWMPMMRKAMKEAGLPEDTVFLSMIESGFSTKAYSHAKASGLWQFIPSTGKRFGLGLDFWRDQRRNPHLATTAATKYLKDLYSEFGDWRLAWAGYNAGEGAIRRAIRAEKTTDFWKIIAGRSLHKETKHYVPKLMAAALIAKNLKFFGFRESELCPEPVWEYDQAEVSEATDLEVIARAAGISVDKVKELNPELRSFCTPPSNSLKGGVYYLRLPKGTGGRFTQNFAKIAPHNRLSFAVHLVKAGDTLSRIAARYKTVPEAIMRMNAIRDSRRLRLRDRLVIPIPSKGARAKLALASRRQGFKAASPKREIPAASRRRRSRAVAGSIRYVKEGRRTKALYGVAPGDSLWAIGRNFGVSVEQLKNWNALRGKRAKLQIGQELVFYPAEKHLRRRQKIASSSSTKRLRAVSTKKTTVQSKMTHVVQMGDTLWSVARRYRVSVANLKRWNKIKHHKKLQIGKSIVVVAP